MPKKLNSQQESIFRLLYEEFDQAWTGTALPSVRKVMARFSVGQQTAQLILSYLAKRYHASPHERRKTRICNASGDADDEIIFCLMGVWRYEWEKIIDKFNATHKLHVTPKFLHYTLEFSCALENADIILFPRASFFLENAIGTDNFIDMRSMVSSLDASRYYPATFQNDVCGKIWGICPYLSTQVLCFDRRLYEVPIRQLDFAEFRDLLCSVRKKTKDKFVFPGCLSNYSELISRWGNLLKPGFQPEDLKYHSREFEDFLDYFRGLFQENLIPRISKQFPTRDDLKLFFHQKIFIKNFSLFRLPAFTGTIFDVLPLPLGENGFHSIYSEIMCIPKLSRIKSGAWEFIQYILHEKTQRQLHALMRTMPVCRGMAPIYMKKRQADLFEDIFWKGSSCPDLLGDLLHLPDKKFERLVLRKK